MLKTYKFKIGLIFYYERVYIDNLLILKYNNINICVDYIINQIGP